MQLSNTHNNCNIIHATGCSKKLCLPSHLYSVATLPRKTNNNIMLCLFDISGPLTVFKVNHNKCSYSNETANA